MNLSDKTRKQLVLDYLRNRANSWVDGPELANERVGGSEGLRRARELRELGHPIDIRRHPNPRLDIWQYRLRTWTTTLDRTEVDREQLVRQLAGETISKHAKALDRLGDIDPKRRVGKPKTGPASIAPETWTLGLEVAPGVVEGTMGPMFKEMPRGADFGSLVTCPRCRGYRKKASHKRDGTIVPADELCYEPYRRPTPCIRCNGFGVVPNKGAIPMVIEME